MMYDATGDVIPKDDLALSGRDPPKENLRNLPCGMSQILDPKMRKPGYEYALLDPVCNTVCLTSQSADSTFNFTVS